MTAARLVLGVGATKAGSSWLHRFLSDHPECHFRGIKEVHYFDAVAFDAYDAQIKQLAQTSGRLLARLAEQPGKHENLNRQLADAAELEALFAQKRPDDAGYLAYLDRGRGDRPVIGDITPAYCLLPEPRMRAMAAIVPDVRVIYVLRDPVARLWSHVRMMAGRRAEAPDEVPDRAHRILRRTLNGKERQIAIRSDYAGALRRLRAAVPADKLLVLFYEEMFTEDGAARICHHLGIARRSAPVDEKVHEGPRVAAREDEQDAMRAWLAPQYDAVRRDLGRLPDAWHAHRTTAPAGPMT
ncbi:sulfotransferase [Rhodobacteraceae bacterium CCMM004]|nr:sulfotransferase [Rhodobacteraceae bacterium CCMM004]